ncbi:MAG: CRISPR-associated protein Cas4 [Deltaproteobacteria bacterium]|nr:CRISPR-associated protein Cas4 [Deltaproteobacteria bacterium]
MNYTEDDLLPISALQHLLFCQRQCALIHIERLWSENRLTAEGRIMHERVHEAHHETRDQVRVEYAVPLRSLRLGLTGIADVVEFHLDNPSGDDRSSQEAALAALIRKRKGAIAKPSSHRRRPRPVEYKRGSAKPGHCDKVQLCAQALCLEEMLNTEIPDGDLYYGKNRRRLNVEFDSELRQVTTDAAEKLHLLVASGQTPRPVYASRCDSCSLVNLCLPKTLDQPRSVRRYLEKAILQDEETP